MGSVKQIVQSANHNFQKHIRNPKVIMVFVIFFALILDTHTPFNRLANQFQVKNTPWFFPFFISNIHMGFYILLGYLLLFCDAPFIDRHQPYIIIRIGKRKWLLGQLLYIVSMSLFFVLVIHLCMILVLLPTLSFSADWGTVIYTLAKTSVQGFLPMFHISSSVVSQYTVWQAELISIVIVWLEGITVGSLMVLLNFKFHKVAGIMAGSIYAGLYFMIKVFATNIPILWKIVPCLWMDFNNMASQRVGMHPGILYSVVGLLLIIGVIWTCLIVGMRKQPIEVIEQG